MFYSLKIRLWLIYNVTYLIKNSVFVVVQIEIICALVFSLISVVHSPVAQVVVWEIFSNSCSYLFHPSFIYCWSSRKNCNKLWCYSSPTLVIASVKDCIWVVVCIKNFIEASLIWLLFKCIHSWAAIIWRRTIKCAILELTTNIKILIEQQCIFDSISEVHVSIRSLSIALCDTFTWEHKNVSFVVLDVIPVSSPSALVETCLICQVWAVVKMKSLLGKTSKCWENERCEFHMKIN